MHWVHRIWLYLLLCISICTSFAAAAQSLYFRNYDLEHGLPSSSVVKVTQDSIGNIWLATAGGGISKFDSEGFTNYSIADGLPNSMLNDLEYSHQKLYIGTASGLSIFDGKHFTNISIDDSYVYNSIFKLHVDSQAAVWMAGPFNGLKVLKEKKIIHYSFPLEPEEARVQSFAGSGDGSIYIGFDTGSLYRYRKGRFKKLKQFDKAVNSLLFTKDSALWVGTRQELYRLRHNSWRLIDTHNCIMLKMVEGKDNKLWVNDGRDLYTIKILPNAIEKLLYKDQPAPNADIISMFLDRDNNLWLNSYLNGVYVGYEAPFRLHPEPELMQTFVFGIQQDSKGNIYYSTLTDGVLVERTDGMVENVTAKLNIPATTLLSALIDRQDRLWISSNSHGLLCVEEGKTRSITTIGDKTSKYARILAQDSKGNIWHFNTHGLYSWDGKKYTSYTTEDGLYSYRVSTICELASGDMLLGTAGGVNLLSNGTISPFLPEHFEKKEITTIVKDTYGNLWFAVMGEGLRYYRHASGRAFSPKHIKAYSQQDGLLSDMIYTLFVDKQGDLWAGTARGINKLKINEKGLVSIESFGESEGFSGKFTNPTAFLIKKNEIYFGSGMGVYIYDSLYNSMKAEARPYLTNVSFNNNEVNWSKQTATINSWTNVPALLRYESGADPIIFKFNTIEYNNKKALLYSYKLSGLNKDWSVPSATATATYANLPPGAYTLQVVAGTKDYIHKAKPYTYPFTVTPAYYQTSWFALLCLGSLLSLIFFTNRAISHYRVRKALALEAFKSKEREAIRHALARDFHDEIGNLIAGIGTYSNVLQLKLKEAPDDILKTLIKIEASSKTLYTGTKDFIWSIDRSNDELVEIFFHVKDFGDQFFTPCGIDFLAENRLDEGRKVPLVQGASRHVTRIFKEMMTNVMKHAEATEVHFTLDYDTSIYSWVITFRDNGKGLSLMDPGGYGFRNMRQRAELIGAELDFIALEKGLAVRLKIEDREAAPLAGVQTARIKDRDRGGISGIWGWVSKRSLSKVFMKWR